MMASFSSARRQSDIDARRIYRADRCFGDFRTDAIAGNQSAVVGHIPIVRARSRPAGSWLCHNESLWLELNAHC